MSYTVHIERNSPNELLDETLEFEEISEALEQLAREAKAAVTRYSSFSAVTSSSLEIEFSYAGQVYRRIKFQAKRSHGRD